MVKSKLLFLFLCFSAIHAMAQPGLRSLPMLGYITSDKATVWVQTTDRVVVQICYTAVSENKKAKTRCTDTVVSTKENAFAISFLLDTLESNQEYYYQVIIEGASWKHAVYSFKTSPKQDSLYDFSCAVGSCNYVVDSLVDKPEKEKGSGYGIYSSICAKKPSAMIWLGDNTYLRKKEWDSYSKILYRYTHTRSFGPMQCLLNSTENYALWDDHDFGPNDSDKTFWKKDSTFLAFKLFWANPSYGFDTIKAAVTSFQKSDVHFFFLDDRTFRTPNNDYAVERHMFGKPQLDWLIESLKKSNASFKLVMTGGQLLNPNEVFESFAKFEEEKKYFLRRLEEEKISGVVLFSGDRHFSEVIQLPRKSTYPLYEFTVSPLTSKVYKDMKEENPLRLPGSLLLENNFAVLSVKGVAKERRLEITYYSSNGVQLFTKELRADELK